MRYYKLLPLVLLFFVSCKKEPQNYHVEYHATADVANFEFRFLSNYGYETRNIKYSKVVTHPIILKSGDTLSLFVNAVGKPGNVYPSIIIDGDTAAINPSNIFIKNTIVYTDSLLTDSIVYNTQVQIITILP